MNPERPDASTLNLMQAMPLYFPNSAGTYADLAALSIQGANCLFSRLGELSTRAGQPRLPVLDAEDFPRNEEEAEAAGAIKRLFDAAGSDKSTAHNYHLLYGPILKDRCATRAILEIGIGTNFTDVPSNMGAGGTPGASLRAFREFLPNARILGADVDARILFREGRITTHFVDQTDPGSLDDLSRQTPDDLDLVIDDGLHSPAANIATLAFAIRKVRKGGWIVIEDIPDRSLPVWDVVPVLLGDSYRCLMARCRAGNAFVVERIA